MVHSICPKIPVSISEIFVCQMQGYFLTRQTNLALFREHVSHQELFKKMLKDCDEVAVLSALSCFMKRDLIGIQNY